MESKKKYIIASLIILLAIGFAAVATILKINGTVKIGFDKEGFIADIIFTKSVLDDEDITEESIIENGKQIKFTSHKLTKNGEQTVLDYVVSNKSNQYAGRANVKILEYDEEYIKIENAPMSFDLLPLSNQDGELIITLIKPAVDDKDLEITVEITVEPIQPEDAVTTSSTSTSSTSTSSTTSEEVDDGKEKYTLEIDPDGGEYNGSRDKVTSELKEGSLVTLDEPTKENYIFDYWLKDEEKLEGNTFTIEKDTKVKAVWVPVSDAVARINDAYFTSIQKAFNKAKDNDTVILLKDTKEIATNTRNITFDLSTHTVTGQITNSGILTVINGKIENTEGSAINNTGTLNLGNNSDEVSITTPEIIGTDYGIENTGTFNFYDGYVEANLWLSGEYNQIPQNYHVFVDHNESKNCQKTYLVKELDNAVARIEEVYYKNLQDAFISAQEENRTVYAIRNFEAAYELKVDEEKEVIFDISGYTITTGNNIINNGTLTIKDSSTEKQGLLSPSLTITNNGKLNMANLIVTATTNANIIENNSVLDIKNSTLTALDGYAVNNISGENITFDDNTYLHANKYAFNNTYNGEISLTGGNIYGLYNNASNANDNSNFILDGNIKTYSASGYVGVYNYLGNMIIKNGNFTNNNSSSAAVYNYRTMTIENGNIISTSNSEALSNSGTLTINNVSITSEGYGISGSSGRLTINGGTITSQKNAINYGNTITINGGEITSTTGYGVITAGGILNIYGGKISGNTGLYLTYTTGVWSTFISTVKIYSGTITGEEYGIHCERTSLYIYDGNVSGGKYGIYNNYNTNVIEIGDNTKDIQNTNPSIIGDLYGLYADIHGKISFYSGILKGKTGSYYGDINIVPNGYTDVCVETDEEGYSASYLIQKDNYVSNGSNQYNSLQDAIDNAQEGDTLTITKDVIINSQITINQNKNIIIDINAHQVRIPNQIINNGQLEIKDSSENMSGTLKGNTISSIGPFISNGTQSILKLSNVNITGIHKSSAYIIKGGKVIINKAKIISNSYLVSCTDCEINNSTLETPYIAIEADNLSIDESKIKNTNTEKYSYGLVTIKKTGQIKNALIESDYSIPLITSQSTVTLINTNVQADVNYALSLSKATVTIESGSIISKNNYGIYNSSSTSTVIIGKEDDNLSTKNPIIKGKDYAIYSYPNSSTITNVYFYDGILKGAIDALNVSINKTPDATSIISSEEDENGNTLKVKYLKEQDNIVSYNGTNYNSLKKALNAIESEGTIELITDANVSSDWEIPENKNITLDLNGYTLTIASDIINRGTLKLTNSLDNGSIQDIGTSYLINNYSELNIESIKMSSIDRSMYIYSGNVKVTNSTIDVSGDYGIYLEAGNLNIDKSNINGSTTNKYTVYLKGGQMDVLDSSIINNNKNTSSNATLYLTNAVVSTENSNIENKYWYAVNLNTKSTFTQNGGTIKANYYGISGSGDFIMNDGEIIATSTAIDSSGNVTINKGNIQGRNYNNGTMSINNATIKCTNDTAIQNSKILNIYNGEISSSKQYGINNSGTITLGDESETENNITITGETYGIYNNDGTLNFYKGVVKGKTERIYGPITKILDGKMVDYGIEDIPESDEKYLTIFLADKHNIISNANSQYSDFATAINNSNDGDTLTLLESINIIDNINVPADKKIKIDLSGHNFNLYGKGVFTNQGELELMDSSKNENKIKHYVSNNIIKNEGTLTINNVTLETINSSYRIYAIKNEGTKLLIDNAVINSAGGGIQNAVDSYLEINNSTLIAGKQSFAYGISNSGNLKIDTSTLYANDAIRTESGNSTLEMTHSTVDSVYLYNADIVNLKDNVFNPYSISNASISINNTNDFKSQNNNYSKYSFSVSSVKNFSSINDTFSGAFSTGSNVVIAVENPTISSNITNSGNLTIDGGNSTGSIENKGNMTINNFEISSETSGTAVTNNTSALLTLNNVNITKKYPNNGEVIGIKVTKGSVLLLDSSIKVSSKGNVYGIYINNGEVTMGKKNDGVVSNEIPYIEALTTATSSSYSAIGVKKVNGKFNFYDGKIVATTEAKPDTTTDVEYLYEAKSHKDEDGNDVCVLEYMEKQE